jgi:hypothetical protein
MCSLLEGYVIGKKMSIMRILVEIFGIVLSHTDFSKLPKKLQS